MENTTNMDRSDYEVLVEKVEKYHTSKTRLEQDVITRRDVFNQLKAFLDSWNFNSAFPALETEVNEMIKNWSYDISLKKLQETLQVLKAKIENIDKALVDFKKEQQMLLRLPDRHGRKEATDKIALFLNNAPQAQMQSIDIINDKIIPQIQTMIDGVKGEFAKEDLRVEKNRKEAKKLKNRVSKYDDYVDRFNLKQWCAEAIQSAEQVLQSPNKANPDDDTDKLAKANRMLDQCIQQFEEEDRLFKELLSTLEEEHRKIWEEDYDIIDTALSKGAYHEPTSASQLKVQFLAAKTRKRKEIDQAVQKYSDNVRNFFAQDIQNLYEEYHSRKDLTRLIAKMDRKAWEERKKLIIRFSIVAAVIIFIIVITATDAWEYIIGGLIWLVIIFGIIKLITYFVKKKWLC